MGGGRCLGRGRPRRSPGVWSLKHGQNRAPDAVLWGHGAAAGGTESCCDDIEQVAYGMVARGHVLGVVASGTEAHDHRMEQTADGTEVCGHGDDAAVGDTNASDQPSNTATCFSFMQATREIMESISVLDRHGHSFPPLNFPAQSCLLTDEQVLFVAQERARLASARINEYCSLLIRPA
ncbi:uncharacterized protein LOC100833899 [Brachypodium distachyon]|uniref:Uncharacterized protein n=1 Tax=Brachypodium distachyon TaxID=15368 RepID=A0A0Q3HRF9_BRADI|nr:uncharacterized protein LOC100833899 [Brachypodium distachyon]KQJ96082.1 hypothetical protein BRADI_3g20853v3 [Brachypodium distachyon]|eukprot:XP_014756609.1 uncharacterized protein LOC100833899 [Brachypodium distachyon]